MVDTNTVLTKYLRTVIKGQKLLCYSETFVSLSPANAELNNTNPNTDLNTLGKKHLTQLLFLAVTPASVCKDTRRE